MIRRATFADIPAIVELLKTSHAASVYADLCAVDHREAQRLVMQSIQRQKLTGDGGTFLAVSETDGKFEGAVLGALQPINLICDKLVATDLFLLTVKGAAPAVKKKLHVAFFKWAEGIEAVAEIYSGVTMQDEDSAAKAFPKHGMSRFGTIYRKEIAR